MANDDKKDDAGRKDSPADKSAEDDTRESTSTADKNADTEAENKTKAENKTRAEKKADRKAADAAKSDGVDDGDSPRKRAGAIPTAVPVTAAIIGVIGLILAGVLFFRPGLDYTNEAYADRASTDEVATAASENAKRLVGIDYETLDEYVDRLPEIMTPDLQDELMKSWDQLSDTYTQAKTKVDVSISDVGVTYLEENRAEVLIAQSVSVTQDGQAAGSTDGTYLVRLEKIDGTWKLSSIPDLPS